MPIDKQWGEIHPDKKGWTRKPGTQEQGHSYKTMNFDHLSIKEKTIELMSEDEFKVFCITRTLIIKNPALFVG